ncbi:MAG: hypothetical protein WC588_01420 [Candidatus Micrarchaeia archaeon]
MGSIVPLAKFNNNLGMEGISAIAAAPGDAGKKRSLLGEIPNVLREIELAETSLFGSLDATREFLQKVKAFLSE